MKSYDAALNLIEFSGNSQFRVMSWEELRGMHERKERNERKKRKRIKRNVSAAWKRKVVSK